MGWEKYKRQKALDFIQEMRDKDDCYLPLPEGLDYEDIWHAEKFEEPYVQSDFI